MRKNNYEFIIELNINSLYNFLLEILHNNKYISTHSIFELELLTFSSQYTHTLTLD